MLSTKEEVIELERNVTMIKERVKEELEKQMQILSKLSESEDLTVADRIRIFYAINTLAITLINL